MPQGGGKAQANRKGLLEERMEGGKPLARPGPVALPPWGGIVPRLEAAPPPVLAASLLRASLSLLPRALSRRRARPGATRCGGFPSRPRRSSLPRPWAGWGWACWADGTGRAGPRATARRSSRAAQESARRHGRSPRGRSAGERERAGTAPLRWPLLYFFSRPPTPQAAIAKK